MRATGLLGVLMGGLVLASTAHGTVMTYSDRATFLADAVGISTIDFGGIAPNGALVPFNTATGLTLSGVNFVGVSGSGFVLNVIDDEYCCTPYTGRGNNVASLASGTTSATVSPFIQVTLPTGITAVGFDLFSVTVGDDLLGSQTDTAQIEIAGNSYSIQTVAANTGSNGRVFFGVISDTAISELTIAPTRTDSTDMDVVDFSFGQGSGESVGSDDPDNPELPVNVQPGPTFEFDFRVVGGQMAFIDPEIAIGYDYAIGAGDPGFRSVLLPEVGDNNFDLILFDPAGNPFDTGIDLLAGLEFDFLAELTGFGVDAAGLDRFSIRGIEISAMLDPHDPTAFVTGLTFVDDGRFTGTMTPVVASVVTETGTLVLLASGLLGLAWRRRRDR